VKQVSEKAVTNTSTNGGWFMISGVDLGKNKNNALQVEVLASSKTGRKLEIYLDDLASGKLIATILVNATGGQNTWKVFKKAVGNVTGHHDVFVKFPAGTHRDLYIQSIRFLKAK
jgi:hypothetical protein